MAHTADGPEEEQPPPGTRDEAAESAPEDGFVGAVFGTPSPERAGPAPGGALESKKTFAPWHHPVKQVVRDYQWAELTRKLMTEERPPEQRHTLRYFTLPGADLLDIRVLAETLQPAGSRIEYFGFDTGYKASASGEREETSGQSGTHFAAEAALRQAGRITESVDIMKGRLEDIAVTGSHAANRLRQQPAFDVINIDACDHLGFVPQSRTTSTFDALEVLLAHQLRASHPWLLFMTTRANPGQLGLPGAKLQNAIHGNLSQHEKEFGEVLADCIGGQLQTIASDIVSSWATLSTNFLKLFCIGIGKYLLQFYHAQHNLPAGVELVSAYAYKVHQPQPDMLSLAFRITPRGLRVQPPTAGSASVTAALELKGAVQVTEKANKLWDLDDAVACSEKVRKEAVEGTARLLKSANYDLPSWKQWLAGLELRPMQLDWFIV